MEHNPWSFMTDIHKRLSKSWWWW